MAFSCIFVIMFKLRNNKREDLNIFICLLCIKKKKNYHAAFCFGKV